MEHVKIANGYKLETVAKGQRLRKQERSISNHQYLTALTSHLSAKQKCKLANCQANARAAEW